MAHLILHHVTAVLPELVHDVVDVDFRVLLLGMVHDDVQRDVGPCPTDPGTADRTKEGNDAYMNSVYTISPEP